MDRNDTGINFMGQNPGAVVHGNFINYYKFHPAGQRTKLIPVEIWKRIASESPICFDVGCNTGDLTVALHGLIQNVLNRRVKILGIDIDPILIQRADENNPDRERIRYECIDVMNRERANFVASFLKRYGKRRFDVALCFSLTMWIHLNHGDDGLERFLKHISELCNLLVLEVQPWKCYKSALKRVKKENGSFPFYERLKIRNDVVDYVDRYVINECRFSKIYQTSETVWGRTIVIYSRSS